MKLTPLLHVMMGCVLVAVFAVRPALAAELKPAESIQSYAVEIDEEALAGLKRLPWDYDFSNLDIWEERHERRCFFEIIRRPIEDRRREKLASGVLDVSGGTIVFAGHEWRTKGMADETYLKNESNLKVLRDGRPVGIMPYFHLFINDGEVARPPLYVELTRDREAGEEGSLNGSFSFYVDDWQEGLLEIRNC